MTRQSRLRKGEINIGSGHKIAFYTQDGVEEPIGLIDFHCKPDGSECSGGSILFDIPENKFVPDHQKWTVESRHPLTLSPSLLCKICGDHGYIRNSKWEKA